MARHDKWQVYMGNKKIMQNSTFFPSTGLAKYRTYSLLAPFFIIGYLIAAIQPAPVGLPEVFPFFKWHLFPGAPAEMTARIELMVRSIEGDELSSRQEFYELGDIFSAARNRDVRVSKSLQPMFAAMTRNDHQTVARYRRLIEDTYMREVDSVEYDIVMTNYDPIKRYHTGETERIHTIVSFTKGAE